MTGFVYYDERMGTIHGVSLRPSPDHAAYAVLSVEDEIALRFMTGEDSPDAWGVSLSPDRLSHVLVPTRPFLVRRLSTDLIPVGALGTAPQTSLILLTMPKEGSLVDVRLINKTKGLDLVCQEVVTAEFLFIDKTTDAIAFTMKVDLKDLAAKKTMVVPTPISIRGEHFDIIAVGSFEHIGFEYRTTLNTFDPSGYEETVTRLPLGSRFEEFVEAPRITAEDFDTLKSCVIIGVADEGRTLTVHMYGDGSIPYDRPHDKTMVVITKPGDIDAVITTVMVELRDGVRINLTSVLPDEFSVYVQLMYERVYSFISETPDTKWVTARHLNSSDPVPPGLIVYRLDKGVLRKTNTVHPSHFRTDEISVDGISVPLCNAPMDFGEIEDLTTIRVKTKAELCTFIDYYEEAGGLAIDPSIPRPLVTLDSPLDRPAAIIFDLIDPTTIKIRVSGGGGPKHASFLGESPTASKYAELFYIKKGDDTFYAPATGPIKDIVELVDGSIHKTPVEITDEFEIHVRMPYFAGYLVKYF
jgi:hypothetical protein